MNGLFLKEFHRTFGGVLDALKGWELIAHYGDSMREHALLNRSVGLLDLSFRSRLCVFGADRERFLNGQVTNDLRVLRTGQGCYAALTNEKARIGSDLNIYRLAEEFLLDFEPGFSSAVAQRLERYIIADEVQIADAAAHYGLLSVQGPLAEAVVRGFAPACELPGARLTFTVLRQAHFGECYLVNQPRVGFPGFDLFVPIASLEAVVQRLIALICNAGGGPCGWNALEIARIEAGIPRFGVDMDETNLLPEAGIEDRAISYSKGCYVGQEIIARIRTYGRVGRVLRGLRLADDLTSPPVRHDRLYRGGHEAGFVTSAVFSPRCSANIALGYVRQEFREIGTELTLQSAGRESPVRVASLPFCPQGISAA